MKTKRWPWAALVAVLVGAAGTAALLLTSDPKKAAMPPMSMATASVSDEQLTQAAKVRLFFGHMSVGDNILAGTESLFKEKSIAAPIIVEVDRNGPFSAPAGGVVMHAAIGENGDPLGKLRNFDVALRAGLADQVDVALLKFCYVDISQDTDVEAVFRAYQSTLEALEQDFPQITFLHSTVPVTVGPSGLKENVKAFLGRDDNEARERYNGLIRAQYGGDRLFDIAAVEGSSPDGTTAPALYSGYTTDGAHLNETGSALAAAALMRILAAGAAS